MPGPYGKPLSPEGLLLRLTTPYDREPDPSNPNFQLAEAVYEAIFEPFVDSLPTLRLQVRLKTATGGFLDKFGNYWLVRRHLSEGDDSYRLRIAQRIAQKWGALNMDELLALAATLLNTSVSNILFSENTYSDGTYAPARVRFGISAQVFLDSGATDVPAAIEELRDALDGAAPAGVIVQVQTLGGAIWDDPGSIWDNADSRWGDDGGGFFPTGGPGSFPPPTGPPRGIGSHPIGGTPIGGP